MSPPREGTPPPIRLLLPGPRTFGRIADGLRRQGYGVERRGPFHTALLFADTGDGRLIRRGFRLRLERSGSVRRWVFDAPGSGPREQRARGTEVSGKGASPVLSPPPGPAADAAREVSGPRVLLGLLAAEVDESLYRFSTPSGGRVAVRMERFTVRPARGGTSASGTLITLDLVDGPPDSLSHLEEFLVHQRGLLPARGDLLEVGLRVLGLQVPGGPPPDSLLVRPEDALSAAARKTVARLALRIEENREGTSEGWDDEFLHDMRVAVRRTRSALRLFTAELGPARAGSLREELRWLGGLLGAVRDLDVFLAGLDAIAPGAAAPPAALDALREQVASLREEYRTHLVRALQSTRYARLLSRVQSIARPRGTRAPTGPTVSQAAPEMVSRAVGRALKAARALGPDPPPEALHRLRILFKRARYACEFFREPFGGPMEAFIPEAVGFQDLLGALQDAQVAAQRVRWAAGVLHGAGRIDLEGSLGLGALIQAYSEEGRRNRRAFLRQWDGSHRALRRLRDEIRAL